MSRKIPEGENAAEDPKTAAAALVNTVNDHTGCALSAEQLAPLVEAVMGDLEAVVEKSVVDEDRLAKLETQTRVLAEAVIAISQPADTLAPAVQAVKDEM